MILEIAIGASLGASVGLAAILASRVSRAIAKRLDVSHTADDNHLGARVVDGTDNAYEPTLRVQYSSPARARKCPDCCDKQGAGDNLRLVPDRALHAQELARVIAPIVALAVMHELEKIALIRQSASDSDMRFKRNAAHHSDGEITTNISVSPANVKPGRASLI